MAVEHTNQKNIKSAQKKPEVNPLYTRFLSGDFGGKSVLFKHGLTNTPIYFCWANMRSRCHNKDDKQYEGYGKRGIIVCDEWRKDSASFFYWAFDNGYCDGLQIDRIDNNGNYCPENCRFVSPSKNISNRRNSKIWFVNGVRYENIVEAAKSNKTTTATISNWCKGYLKRGKKYPPKPNCWFELKYKEL